MFARAAMLSSPFANTRGGLAPAVLSPERPECPERVGAGARLRLRLSLSRDEGGGKEAVMSCSPRSHARSEYDNVVLAGVEHYGSSGDDPGTPNERRQAFSNNEDVCSGLERHLAESASACEELEHTDFAAARQRDNARGAQCCCALFLRCWRNPI